MKRGPGRCDPAARRFLSLAVGGLGPDERGVTMARRTPLEPELVGHAVLRFRPAHAR
jgi:hypothetical protein